MAKLTIHDLLNRLQKFNPEKTADDIIMRNGQDFAVSMNRQQMIDGEDSKGNEIAPSYFSPTYSAFKNKLNPRPGLGTPDLRKTGRFQDLMKFIKKGKKYFITSIDQKTGMLVTKYGEDIFGLDKINSQSFRNKNDKDFCDEFAKVFK